MPKRGDLLEIGLTLLECVFEYLQKTTLITKIHRVLVFAGVAIIGLTVFTFLLQPIYQESPLIMEFWLPTDNPFITAMLWLLQSHSLYAALMIIIGTDSLFVAMCVHMYVQLLLLQQEYGKLVLPANCTPEEEIECRKKLRICVIHHQFLLRLFGGMRKVYSPLYLAQFFSTLISTCMDFFIISTNAESLDIAEVINKFFYVATIQIQFALYCFPAEYLTEQLKNLSDAVYASKWYESKPSFRRELTMVMAASLKQSAFTAGGFSDVRMSTFTNVKF
nr:putative odorant receptor 19b [Onthophagus taurus]